jgi:thymidine phosphorylase
MRPGIFFFVVGASGVGKNTLITKAMASLMTTGRYVPVTNAITRAAAPGEVHEPLCADNFRQREASGGFLHSWEAHGLPASISGDLGAGRNVVANGARAAIAGLIGKVSPLVVVDRLFVHWRDRVRIHSVRWRARLCDRLCLQQF